MGFPCDSASKELTCNAGDQSSISELGRTPGEGKGYPLQYSGLENSMDCIVHRVAKSLTWLSDFHFTSLEMNILFPFLSLDLIQIISFRHWLKCVHVCQVASVVYDSLQHYEQ